VKRLLVAVIAVCAMVATAYAGRDVGTDFSPGVTNGTPDPAAYGTVVRIAGGNKCVATEAAPEHVEGEEVALSCKLNGDLRTTAGAGGGGSGGPVQTLTIASGVTSNSVGATVAGVVGAKSFYGEVVGTGAVTATISLYCTRVASATPTAATAVLLGTITLSGTTQHQDMTPVSTAACKNIFPVFTSITGTGATVLVEAWY
jgi:hypothetical protein